MEGEKNTQDITGQTFNQLTALYYSKTEKGVRLWLCKCSCENTREVSVWTLRQGVTKMCKHCAKESYKHGKNSLDLLGKKIGKLTFVEKLTDRYFTSVMWKAQCDCGKLIKVAGSSVTSGNTRSCGCIRKESMQEYKSRTLTAKKPSYAARYILHENGKKYDLLKLSKEMS